MTPSGQNPTTRAPAAFVTTHWTRVLATRGDSPEAQAALGDLCAAYYAPVLAFLRRSGRDDDAARDLAQEFFARLLARRGLDTVEPGRGRFRSFLLGAVKHFLADQHDRAHAAKRGGGQSPLPLDASSTGDTTHGGGGINSALLQIPDPAAAVPDTFFDRQWALTILDRALAALAAEHAAAGKADHFEALKPWLTGDSPLAETLSRTRESRDRPDRRQRCGGADGIGLPARSVVAPGVTKVNGRIKHRAFFFRKADWFTNLPHPVLSTRRGRIFRRRGVNSRGWIRTVSGRIAMRRSGCRPAGLGNG